MSLKHGKLQQAAFAEPGGKAIEKWIDVYSNADFAALTYQGGAAWRTRLIADIGSDASTAKLIGRYDDDALSNLMTNLGGHCIETLLEAFSEADDETPTMFIAYTIKGNGLPFAGHKDNHSGLINPTQIGLMRDELGIADGMEWEPYAGLGHDAATRLEAFVMGSALGQAPANRVAEKVHLPDRFPVPNGFEQSTQAAFGRILLEISKSGGALADRIVTTSPDVTVSTNLGSFVNQREHFDEMNLRTYSPAPRSHLRRNGQPIVPVSISNLV